MTLDALLPESISALAAASVVAASFFTALLTAAFGLGGGLVLLAAMSVALPPAAVIPIHGVAQFGANFSRLALLRKHVVWPIIIWFAGGGAIGAFLGAQLYLDLPSWALRAGVAAFILFMVWGPKPKSFAPGPRTFFGVGAVGGLLTMFFGATGPLAASMLSATDHDRLGTVSTHAAAMVAQHGLKSIAFGAIGFAFGPWAAIIIGIILAGFAGSWVGTRILHRMPEAQFQKGFRFVLTAIALYLAALSLREAL